MAGSDTFSTYVSSSGVAAADPDGICLSQTPGGASNLTINGALTSGGEATLSSTGVVARNVSVTSGGSSETGKKFTITGTDSAGNAVSEEISGPGSSATVYTSKAFTIVTQVAVDGATSGAVTVGSGTTVASTIFAGRARLRGIYFVNSASSGLLSFTDGNNGTTVLQLLTTGTASSADYPDIPDEGLLCVEGAFVHYIAADVTAVTVFYN